MLISIGLDFGFAPIEVRERFHRSEAEVEGRYASMDRTRRGVEVVFVSTCNRLELYAWDPAAAEDPDRAFRDLAERWAPGRAERDELLQRSKLRSGRAVARHLLAVAAGLESQILGDIHILGQLRKSFRAAHQADVLGGHLHRLFEAAFRAGKAVRRETELMAGRSSVGSEAAGRALRVPEPAEDRHVVVLGCGKVGSHAAETLAERRVGRLTLVNRTRSRAEALSRELDAEVVDWDDLHEVVARADAVIVATGAPTPILRVDALHELRMGEAGHDHPLLVLDVGMPRNVAPDPAGERSDILLVDLDALHPEMASVERARRAAVPQAEDVVETEVESFFSWLAVQPAREALEPLRETLTAICERELAYAAGEEVANRTASRIVAKVLASPMVHLRDECQNGRPVQDVAEVLSTLFADDETPSPALNSRGD